MQLIGSILKHFSEDWNVFKKQKAKQPQKNLN